MPDSADRLVFFRLFYNMGEKLSTQMERFFEVHFSDCVWTECSDFEIEIFCMFEIANLPQNATEVVRFLK